MTTTPTQLSTALTTSTPALPLPSPTFLHTLLTTQRTQPPLPALLATAKHRLLNTSWSSAPAALAPNTPSFPSNVCSPHVPALTLPDRIPAQVLGVEDLSRSRWEQVEAMEAEERGEMMKGREIVRVVDFDEGEGGGGRNGGAGAGAGARGGAGAGGRGTHRLVLQDVKGQVVYGVELKPVDGIGMDMSIGTKVFLSNVTVARGVLLLEPETVVVLGGKIEVLHKEWVENRKKDLLAAIERQAH